MKRTMTGMTEKSGFVCGFLRSCFLIVFLISCALLLHAGESPYSSPIVPADIARTYFPGSEGYLRPADGRLESLVERARYYESNGNFEQALRAYTMASRRAAGSPAAPYILFKQCSLEKDPERAAGCLSSIIETFPDFPLINAVRYELAFRRYLMQALSRALEILGDIEESEREEIPVLTPSALFLSGIIRAEQGEHTDALILYERSIESMQQTGVEDRAEFYAGLYLEIAKSLYALGKLDEAESLLLRVYGSAPTVLLRHEALFRLGLLYESRSDEVGAYSVYSILREEHPGSPFELQARRKLEAMEPVQRRPIEGLYDGSILIGRYGRGEGGGTDEVEPDEVEPVQEKGYFVQIGSFSREENARTLEQQLQQLGFPASTVQARVNGEDFFRVRVGSYGGKEEARRVLSLLQEQGYNGYVLREE
jgi:tetratricopeptide (TPR) repeat protein